MEKNWNKILNQSIESNIDYEMKYTIKGSRGVLILRVVSSKSFPSLFLFEFESIDFSRKNETSRYEVAR